MKIHNGTEYVDLKDQWPDLNLLYEFVLPKLQTIQEKNQLEEFIFQGEPELAFDYITGSLLEQKITIPPQEIYDAIIRIYNDLVQSDFAKEYMETRPEMFKDPSTLK